MTDFGGLGGMVARRPLDDADEFELAIHRALGDAMKTNEDLCSEMWSAMANMVWVHKNGDTASYSFRAAGDVIAAVIGRGNYMDWYCSGPYATVSARIADAMAQEGWHPKT